MRYLLTWLLLSGLAWPTLSAQSGEASPRWEMSLRLGQYPARLLVPDFSEFHPGANLALRRIWNAHPQHHLTQSFNLGYFYHSHLQHATQLYTEVGYRWQLASGLRLTPLAVGGGYVLSVLDMNSVALNEAGVYEVQPVVANHNWLISLGAGLGYETSWHCGDRPIAIEVAYRVQVQGIIVQETIPLLAYAPLMLGLSLPL